MRLATRFLTVPLAIFGVLSLAACSQLQQTCTTVDDMLAAVDGALAQAVAAAEAGDLDAVSRALNDANTAASDAASGGDGALSGISQGLRDGLSGITEGVTSGIDAAGDTVAGIDAQITAVKQQLASAQQLVTAQRDAVAGICGGS